MIVTNIKQKLLDMGVSLDDIVMGDFDYIAEFTAKRSRSVNDPNYRKFGAFYRSNYERGILVYNLIRKFNLKSVLEIGFGRGYTSLCAAKAFYDGGVDGKIVTIDPNLPDSLNNLKQVFPEQILHYIQPVCGVSQQVLQTLQGEFDLVYIDGDHSYEGTKADWELTKDRFTHFCLFDDYHMPTKQDPGIQCSQLIDLIDPKEVKCLEPELIIMDRRMFVDERGYSDDQIDYGQVLFTKETIQTDEEW